MSEASEQAEDIRQLTSALFAARAALADAEKQSESYAKSITAGSQAIDHAKVVELEASREVARAAADAAQSAVRAAAVRMAADNDAAAVARRNAAAAKRLADEKAAAEKTAAAEALEAWKAASERGRVAEAVTREHTRATKELETSLAGAARAAGASAVGFVRTNASLSGFAAAAGPYVAGIAGVAHILSEATAETARHERALRLLGPAYAEVERATAGAMSAEQALNLQGEINAAGVRVNAQELGLLTRAAREYALATGNDVSQALAKLSNAIVNNSEDALSELNLSQARSTSSAQTLANMTELLSQRYRGLAPTAQQADERVESFNRAAKEAGATLLTGLARGAETALGAMFRLGGGTESVTQTLKNFSREMRDAMNDDPEAMNAASNRALARIQEVRQQYELQRRAFQSSSMLQGSDIQLPDVAQLTVRQREAMVALFQESSRLSNEDFQTRARNILAQSQMEQTAAQQRRVMTEMEQRVEADGAADRKAHETDSLGMLRHEAALHGIRLNLSVAAVTPQQRINFLQRELGRLLQEEQAARDANNNARVREAQDKQAQVIQELQQRTAQAQQAAQTAFERRRALELAREELSTTVLAGQALGVEQARKAEIITRDERLSRIERDALDIRRRAWETEADVLTRRNQALTELNRIRTENIANERRAFESYQQGLALASTGSDQEVTRRTQLLERFNEQVQTWANSAANSDSLRALEERTRRAVVGGDRATLESEMRARMTEMERIYANGADTSASGAARLQQLQAEAAAIQSVAQSWREASDPIAALRETFGLAQAQSQTTAQSMAQGAKAAADGFGELAQRAVEAGMAAAASGEDGVAAVAKSVDEWAGAKALQWGLQSFEALAGAGLAYFIRPDAVPGLLASAAQYAGLAAAAGVTAAAIPNAPAASAGSGGSGSGDRGLGMASSMRSESAATTKAPAPVVFNVSGFTSTESAQEGIVRALSEAQARGLISRSWS